MDQNLITSVICTRRYPFAFGALLLVISLGACTPATVGGVREVGPERQFTFVAQENYQSVYRKVLDQMRNCYQVIQHWIVQGDLYTDTKFGTITQTVHSMGVQIYQVIDIAAIDEEQTKVTGYYPFGPVEKHGRKLTAWVLENSKECNP